MNFELSQYQQLKLDVAKAYANHQYSLAITLNQQIWLFLEQVKKSKPAMQKGAEAEQFMIMRSIAYCYLMMAQLDPSRQKSSLLSAIHQSNLAIVNLPTFNDAKELTTLYKEIHLIRAAAQYLLTLHLWNSALNIEDKIPTLEAAYSVFKIFLQSIKEYSDLKASVNLKLKLPNKGEVTQLHDFITGLLKEQYQQEKAINHKRKRDNFSNEFKGKTMYLDKKMKTSQPTNENKSIYFEEFHPSPISTKKPKKVSHRVAIDGFTHLKTFSMNEDVLPVNDRQYLKDLSDRNNNNPDYSKSQTKRKGKFESEEKASEFSLMREKLGTSTQQDQKNIYPDKTVRHEVLEYFKNIFHQELKERDEDVVFKAGLMRSIARFHRKAYLYYIEEDQSKEVDYLEERLGVVSLLAKRSFLRVGHSMAGGACELLIFSHTLSLREKYKLDNEASQMQEEESQKQYEKDYLNIYNNLYAAAEKNAMATLQSNEFRGENSFWGCRVSKEYEVISGENIFKRTLGEIIEEYLLELEDVFDNQGNMSEFLVDLLSHLQDECKAGNINKVWLHDQLKLVPDLEAANLFEDSSYFSLQLYVKPVVHSVVEEVFEAFLKEEETPVIKLIL